VPVRIRNRIRDTGSGAFLTPRSGIRDPGSGIGFFRIPDLGAGIQDLGCKNQDPGLNRGSATGRCIEIRISRHTCRLGQAVQQAGQKERHAISKGEDRRDRKGRTVRRDGLKDRQNRKTGMADGQQSKNMKGKQDRKSGALM
jgi:hypothetical protein